MQRSARKELEKIFFKKKTCRCRSAVFCGASSCQKSTLKRNITCEEKYRIEPPFEKRKVDAKCSHELYTECRRLADLLIPARCARHTSCSHRGNLKKQTMKKQKKKHNSEA